MAKIIAVSADDSTFYTLPGPGGSYSEDGATINDTILGQTFSSSSSGLISSTISSSAYYKGIAGWKNVVKKEGTTTAMTDEACSLVSGKTYQIDAASKRIIDIGVAVVVDDNGSSVDAANIESINYLTGSVTFVDSYTPTTPITISGSYLPSAAIASYKTVDLTMSANAIDTTDLPTAQSNGGYRTYSPGLRTVSISLNGVYNSSNDFTTLLQDRDRFVVEINPDGNSKSYARGFFTTTSRSQSGDVGALEDESLNFTLQVPEAASTPFTWIHENDSTIPDAVKVILNAWENETTVYVKYLPDGSTGVKASAVVTNVSMSGGEGNMTQFNADFQISGSVTAI